MRFLRPLRRFSSNLWICALLLFVLFVTWTGPRFNSASHNGDARWVVKLLENAKQRKEKLRLTSSQHSSDQLGNQYTQKPIDMHEYDLQNPINDQNNAASAQNGFPRNTADDLAGSLPPSLPEPSLEYELMRRRLESNIAEMWNYFNSELGKIRKKAEPALAENVDQVLQLGAEHKRSLLSDMERLRQVDGYESWREQEARNLSDLVQRRLHYLQNPKDCNNARKLMCIIDMDCGLGCHLHHVVVCFILAYATERTMIVKSDEWRFENNGWEQVFLSVSKTCVDANISQAAHWPGNHDAQLLQVRIIMYTSLRQAHLPLSIPEDLAPRLMRFHGYPFVWWLGQFLKYLFRPQKPIVDFLESRRKKLDFQKPIVGVHVRRTDKMGTEAAFYSIDEYMLHVEDYFLTLDINSTVRVSRRIFLATDEPRVIEEARRKYPHYVILADEEVARMAAMLTRYTDTALNGIILDIHLLSLCDYLVCTFSSNLCRVAYEIMQMLQPDAAHRFKSLDETFFFVGQNSRHHKAVLRHVARSYREISMMPHDLLKTGEIHLSIPDVDFRGLYGNHWDGFSRGLNMRTYEDALFPSFKAVKKVHTVKLPLYEQVPVQL